MSRKCRHSRIFEANPPGGDHARNERRTWIVIRLETEGDRVTDLHLWRMGRGTTPRSSRSCRTIPKPPEHYKSRLAELTGLSHVTIEVQPCDRDQRVA